MNRYLATVMCCVGAAACSTQHASEEPNSADDVGSTTYSTSAGSTTTTHDSSDGELRPASSDGLSATPSDSARTPSGSSDNYHYTNAPTSGPAPDKGTAPAAGSTPAPSSAPATAPSDKTKAATPPDNTKINERDRKSSALTPFDQGEGAADLDITKRIRQAVMADKSLSFTAKNVKIITRDGKVVLRGPVNSAEERASIEAAAQKVAGGSNVENQLEVKH